MTQQTSPLRWWHRFTGGRPMMKLVFAFTDVVVGEKVYLWADAYGRFWLATGAWSRFRVPSEHCEAWLVERPEWSIFR